MVPRTRPKTSTNADANPEPLIKRQTVAGFIVFRQAEEGNKYLLLYRRGNYWNFPKGKFEEGEDALAAALRETREETGIAEAELRIIPSFKTNLRYNFRIGNERIYDTLVLHLAETEKEQVALIPREHSGYAWFYFADAMKILNVRYAGTRRALKQAHDFLRKTENGTKEAAEVASTAPSVARRRRRGGVRHRRRPTVHGETGAPAQPRRDGRSADAMRPRPIFIKQRERRDVS